MKTPYTEYIINAEITLAIAGDGIKTKEEISEQFNKVVCSVPQVLRCESSAQVFPHLDEERIVV